MGGSLSSLMGDIHALMNHQVHEALEKTPSNHKPSIFYRYVNDCFAVFDSLDSIEILCNSLNEIRPNIKFATEIQNNKCINFLDVKKLKCLGSSAYVKYWMKFRTTANRFKIAFSVNRP